MTVNKRKKNSRARGEWTHGHGSKKKWRGSGNRGGVGNAGSGKRGDSKKPTVWKNRKDAPKYSGKFGFKSKSRTKTHNAINLSDIEDNILSLEKKGFAEKKGDMYNLDISKLGASKLLGSGKIKGKYSITAFTASSSAVEKIKKAGGSVKLLSSKDSEQSEKSIKQENTSEAPEA